MKTCKVKDVVIGEGKPKVCLPIVACRDEEIIDQALRFNDVCCDLVELRIDYYKDIDDQKKLLTLLKKVKSSISKPLLFTCRSLKEGGQGLLTINQYCQLLKMVCENKLADLIDIELSCGDNVVLDLVNMAHDKGVYTIISNHDFHTTPADDVIIERLNKMADLKGDIAKIAYMPKTREDVRRLLDVTAIMSHQLDIPLISMSMSDLGKVTRICGELYGSALTFACLDKASAPGQIDVNEMNSILDLLHYQE